MKYPLTEATKQISIQLVDAWANNHLNQSFILRVVTTANAGATRLKIALGRLDKDLDFELTLGQVRELSAYGLINIVETFDQRGSWRLEATLLQELINAVENEFEVSEYFLTMNAVGTIVQGNITMQPGSVLQSAASNTGNVTQSIEQVSDNLRTVLGEELLQSQAELRDAIMGLRSATETEKQSKLGKVVSELGRCLQHGANTATIVNALSMLAPLLQNL